MVVKVSQSSPVETNSGTVELSESDRHLLLAVERRRVALDLLTEGGALIFLNELAAAVAVREANGAVATDEVVEGVAVSLHHRHLPKMEELGVIEYYPEERLVINQLRNWNEASQQDT